MRIFFFLVLILGLAGAWIGGWFFVADQVEKVIEKTKIRLAERGQTVQCENRKITGFPFRISIFCDSLFYGSSVSGIKIRFANMRSATQFYQPGKAVVEFDQPASVFAPHAGSFNVEWSSMRASFNASLDGPERFSLHGKNLLVRQFSNNHQTKIKNFQIHGRKAAGNAVDYALSLENAKSPFQTWPAFNSSLNLHLENAYSDLLRQMNILLLARKNGLKGRIEKFDFQSLDGGRMTASGPAEVSRDGLLTGKFDVQLSDLEKLLDSLGRMFPDRQSDFTNASKVISLFGDGGSGTSVRMPLVVNRGKVRLGIVPLGNIPPLY